MAGRTSAPRAWPRAATPEPTAGLVDVELPVARDTARWPGNGLVERVMLRRGEFPGGVHFPGLVAVEPDLARRGDLDERVPRPGRLGAPGRRSGALTHSPV